MKLQFGDWVKHKKTKRKGIITQEEGTYTEDGKVWVVWENALVDTLHQQGSYSVDELIKIVDHRGN